MRDWRRQTDKLREEFTWGLGAKLALRAVSTASWMEAVCVLGSTNWTFSASEPMIALGRVGDLAALGIEHAGLVSHARADTVEYAHP